MSNIFLEFDLIVRKLATMKKQRMSVKDRADIDFLSGDQNETV